MIFNLKYLTLLVLVVFTSCKPNKIDYESIDSVEGMLDLFEKQEFVDTEVYINDSVNLISPLSLNIVDDLLLIYDQDLDHNKMIQVFDMQKEEFIGNMLTKGKGPNEHFSITLCSYTSDTIMVLSKKQALLYSKNKLRYLNEEPDRIINFNCLSEGDNIRACFRFKDYFILSGQFAVGRFHVFDLKGKHVGYFGRYPEIDFSGDYDNYHLGFLFSGSDRVVSAGNNLFCLNNKSLSQYEFKGAMQFDEISFIQWDSPFVGQVGYQNGKAYAIQGLPGNQIGAGELRSNDEEFFFTFSKHDFLQMAKGTITNEHNFILVFNTKGFPERIMELDKPIRSSLVIGNKGLFLYSIHINEQNGFSEIIKIPIKEK